MDTIVNKRGQDLIELAERNKLFIINGRFPGNYLGEHTFVNTQGRSIIEIVLYNYSALYSVLDFKVNNYITKPNHFPVEMIIKNNINNNKNSKSIRWRENKSIEFFNSMSFSCNMGKIDLDINNMSINLTSTIQNTANKLKMTS